MPGYQPHPHIRGSVLLLFGEEDGEVGGNLVFGAHFAVLLEERHVDDGIVVPAIQFVMLEQSCNGAGSAQE